MKQKVAHTDNESIRGFTNKEPDASIVFKKFAFKNSMIAPALIILAYVLLVTFTPNWYALDVNATRFLTLSVINLVAFAYLLGSNKILQKHSLSRFFTGKIGLVYTGFLAISLLSITQAINFPEAIVHFAKLFSVFSAVMVMFLILLYDLRFVKMIIILMVLLLVFDSLWVYQQVAQFIAGNVARINDITTIYSNKNILSASIFLKLPFALSMLMFDRGLLRYFGWAALFFGMLAIFLLASRAFYVGLLVLSPVFVVYTIISYARWREKIHIKLGGSYLLALLLAFSIHSLVQKNILPEVERHTQPVQTQLAIISTVIKEDTTVVRTEASAWERLDSWRWSLNVISETPLLGVGPGNWKVNILKHENQENPEFLYMYKAHNDFLEHMAEAGIAGGLLYLAIFVLTGWTFVLRYRKHTGKSGLPYRTLFLAIAGLAAFAVDAFFNFPADRPAISLYWILFLSMFMAASALYKRERLSGSTNNNPVNPGRSDQLPKLPVGYLPKVSIATGISWLLYLLIAITSGVLFLNYQSSVVQQLFVDDIRTGKLRYENDLNIGPLSTWTLSDDNPRITNRTRRFPAVPGISLWGESLHALQARYLIKENKYQKAINILMSDHTNPWDSRREYLLSKAYSMLNKPDSALYYAQKALTLKPNHALYIQRVQQLTDAAEEPNASVEKR